MIVKNILWEDFVNYKKPSLFICTSLCDFKCEREDPSCECQNSELACAPAHEIDNAEIIRRYKNNEITEAVVIGGMEPFDTFTDTLNFIKDFRADCDDDIVIYTGYYPYEIEEQIKILGSYANIVVKFGRYTNKLQSVYDDVLGITLVSQNQFAQRL